MPQLQPRIAIVQLSGVQWGTWIITDECLSVVFFFSSSLADVALRLGPYMSISCRKDVCTRTPLVHMSRQIEVKTTNKKHTNHQTTTTRKSPSQTCVSPEETAKQTTANQTQKKTGPEPKQNTHKIDLPRDTVA